MKKIEPPSITDKRKEGATCCSLQKEEVQEEVFLEEEIMEEKMLTEGDGEEESYLDDAVKARIVGLIAPAGTTMGEVDDLRRSVLGIFNEQKERMVNTAFSVPPQVVAKYVCGSCGNRRQELFLEATGGDVVCLGGDGEGCGAVAEHHKMHEGSQYRKFEGEEDKSHHGPAPNKLYSASHNMRTNLVAFPGAPGAAAKAAKLRQVSEQVELGLSNLGRKDERRTREGYKDAQKKRAFDIIAHAANNLNLNKPIVDRAQELFAAYRDAKEALHKFNTVIAACVTQAAEDSAKDDALRSQDKNNNEEKKPLFRPALTSRRAALLQKPISSLKRLREEEKDELHSFPSEDKRRPDDEAHKKKKVPQRSVRAGKAWALALADLDALPEE